MKELLEGFWNMPVHELHDKVEVFLSGVVLTFGVVVVVMVVVGAVAFAIHRSRRKHGSLLRF